MEEQDLKIGVVYTHIKSGGLYTIKDFCNVEVPENVAWSKAVIYYPLRGVDKEYYVRTIESFCKSFKI